MYRCVAQAVPNSDALSAAAQIVSPVTETDWATDITVQCKVDDVPHDHHAAFLRSGASLDPCTDVFLCWRDNDDKQWVEDVEVCMQRRTPLGTGCTIFRGHPGRCDWAYIDPPSLAVEAQADQLLRDLQGGTP